MVVWYHHTYLCAAASLFQRMPMMKWKGCHAAISLVSFNSNGLIDFQVASLFFIPPNRADK